jgi:hypothetical protein
MIVPTKSQGQARILGRRGGRAGAAPISAIGPRGAKHPQFGEALKLGKKEADQRVERSLYQKAVGYSYDAVKIFMPAGAKKPVIVPYREHVPPSDVACIFWLKNRDPGALARRLADRGERGEIHHQR